MKKEPQERGFIKITSAEQLKPGMRVVYYYPLFHNLDATLIERKAGEVMEWVVHYDDPPDTGYITRWLEASLLNNGWMAHPTIGSQISEALLKL